MRKWRDALNPVAKSVKYGGLSEEQCLKMVTLNPAKMLHVDDRVEATRK